jgi:tetratricopeptide (TPR) repeat protein
VQPKLSSRPSPFATGCLTQRPLAHLLVHVLDRGLSGSFELLTPQGEHVHIFVQDGRVARLATSKPVVYLGHVLYELGAIDGVQLSQSLAVIAATRRLHGQVLLARGMIDAEGLAHGLRRQRSRKLHYAFELAPDSTFAFYPGTDLVGERPGDVEPMDPLPSIWRGVLLRPAWDHVRSTLATVGERPLRMPGSVDRLELEDKDLETVKRLRVTPTKVADLSRLAGLEARRAELLAYVLVIAKLAELGRRPETSDRPKEPKKETLVRETPRETPGTSGHYVRAMSFAMRAMSADEGPLRIPSPAPFTPGVPRARTQIDLEAPRKARSLEAEHALSQAEMHMMLGERAQAMAFANKALGYEHGMPEATVFLAYAEMLALGPDEKALLQESLDVVDAILRKKASCKRAHYYRAEIKRRLQDHAGAIDDLRVAVAQDPNDVDARRELRIYDQRVRDGSIRLGSSPHSAGWMRRLRRPRS